MVEELKPPRIEGDELVIETQSRTETYDSKYMLAALLLYVVKGGSKISDNQSQQMLGLIEKQFGIASAESLELLRRAMTDLAENPDMDGLLREMSAMLSEHEKEDFAVMMLKAAAADGPQDADEMEKLQRAAEIIGIASDTLHSAYDRYFAETDTDQKT